ncbi:hypothetical protein DOTSEDRAFT_166965 [Dothistroma septosporum NZE10]|uniref:Aminotransferase class V domain-containing protein n=1 Tax=Dothistroma septosporum (strain NZE10 / CBS 128990) TaxID=675120 RepID=N1PWD1_DOTSN|nr:hypothetical protein DOTSEDRAFT_166965 [Dothistroma septosporum NZE10]
MSNPRLSNDSPTVIDAIGRIDCGKDAAKHFGFAKNYMNLNHGSFGTYPLEIRSVLRHFQDQHEERPDWFIRYEYPRLNDEARTAIAKYLRASVEAVVFVPNASTGVNTVLRNLVYQPGDIIIYFATIYGSCHKTIEYITETTPALSRKVEYTYPISDKDLCSKFEATIRKIKAEGKNPRIAVFDTIVSMPGVRMPFEELTRLCKSHGVLSMIDAAHSVGQIPLNLTELDPDFFVSNCHKWLHTPRACAVFYVPERNHHLMRSSLPTSHGFVPLDDGGQVSPLPPSSKSVFVNNFEFVGTLDSSPYLCIPAALQWRSQLAYKDLQGEEAIFAYDEELAREGGQKVAAILGTEVMDNPEQTLTKCSFANIQLPLSYREITGGDYGTAVKIARWISQVLVDQHNTFLALLIHDDKFWVRLSAQVYLTIEDFEWAGRALQQVCDRARNREWQDGKSKI